MFKTLSGAEKFLAACAALLVIVLAFAAYNTAHSQIVTGDATVPFATLHLPAPVTEYTDGSKIPSTVKITYQIWQGEKGANKALIVSDWDGTPKTLTVGLAWNKTTCWKVSTKADAISSDAWSPEVCKTQPPPPAPPQPKKPKAPVTIIAS